MHAGYEEEEEAERQTSQARDDRENHYGRGRAAMHRCLLPSEFRTHCGLRRAGAAPVYRVSQTRLPKCIQVVHGT